MINKLARRGYSITYNEISRFKQSSLHLQVALQHVFDVYYFKTIEHHNGISEGARWGMEGDEKLEIAISIRSLDGITISGLTNVTLDSTI